MLDCGASKTLMCINTLNMSGMADKYNVQEFKEKRALSTALIDSNSEILAKMNVNIQFETETKEKVLIPHEIYLVSGLAHTLFLGNDFINSNYHVLNTANRMYIKSDDSPVGDLQIISPEWHRVKIKQQYFKPNETLLASADKTIEAGAHCMIEIRAPQATSADLYSITASLEVPDITYFTSPGEKSIRIPVYNNGDHAIEIHEGQKVIQAKNNRSVEQIHNLRVETEIGPAKETNEMRILRMNFEELGEKIDDSYALPTDDSVEIPATDEEMVAKVDMTHLPELEREKYRKLLFDNIDIFSRTTTDIGCTDLYTATVVQKEDVNPSDFQPKYIPIPAHLREKVSTLIRKLITAGVLKYAAEIPKLISNVHVRIKPTGAVRLCLDARSTNYIAKRLPTAAAYTMEEVLTMVNDRKVSLIDISQSFFNIPLSDASHEYFSFLDPDRRVIQLTRLCQGHHNSPTHQGKAIRSMLDQRASAKVPEFPIPNLGESKEGIDLLSDENLDAPSTSMYVQNPEMDNGRFVDSADWQTVNDKIILFNIWDDLGPSTAPKSCDQTHREGLQLLFNKIRRGKMKLRIEKLQLCPPTLKLLGYEFKNNTLNIPPKRLQALRDMSLSTARQIKSFIASAAYYRAFSASFSTKAYELMQEANKHGRGTKIRPKEEIEKLRKGLLDELEDNACRHPYTAGTPLTIQTDSSKYAMGATLDMLVDGKQVPVASFSRIYSKTERNYNIFFKEAMAVAAALNHFEYYVKGANALTVMTDVKAILFIRLTSDVSSVAYRLSSEISRHPIKIIHAPSRAHFQTDAISRHEEADRNGKGMSMEEALTLVNRIKETKEKYSKEEVDCILRFSPPESLILPKLVGTTKFPQAPRLRPTIALEKRIRKPVFVERNPGNENVRWRMPLARTRTRIHTLFTIPEDDAADPDMTAEENARVFGSDETVEPASDNSGPLTVPSSPPTNFRTSSSSEQNEPDLAFSFEPLRRSKRILDKKPLAEPIGDVLGKANEGSNEKADQFPSRPTQQREKKERSSDDSSTGKRALFLRPIDDSHPSYTRSISTPASSPLLPDFSGQEELVSSRDETPSDPRSAATNHERDNRGLLQNSVKDLPRGGEIASAIKSPRDITHDFVPPSNHDLKVTDETHASSLIRDESYLHPDNFESDENAAPQPFSKEKEQTRTKKQTEPPDERYPSSGRPDSSALDDQEWITDDEEELDKNWRNDTDLMALQAGELYLKTGAFPPDLLAAMQEFDDKLSKQFENPQQPFEKINNILMKTERGRSKICIPASLIKPLVHMAHFTISGGHRTKDAISRHLQQDYFYPTLGAEISRAINGCAICSYARKDDITRQSQEEAFQTKIPRTAYYMDIMDLGTGAQEKLGAQFRYHLVAICCASNYILTFPMHDRTKAVIRQAILEGIFSPMGAPLAIIADNESSFKSKVVQDLLDLYKVRFHAISPHSPWSNKAEVAIKKIKALMRPTIHAHDSWESLLPMIKQTLNATPNKHGCSPEEYFFHSSIGVPNQAMRVVRTHTANGEACEEAVSRFMDQHNKKLHQQALVRKKFNKNRGKKAISCGQLVTIRSLELDGSRSLRLCNKGPYVVQDKLTNNSYNVRHTKSGRVLKKHANVIFPILPGHENTFLKHGWAKRLTDGGKNPYLRYEEEKEDRKDDTPIVSYDNLSRGVENKAATVRSGLDLSRDGDLNEPASTDATDFFTEANEQPDQSSSTPHSSPIFPLRGPAATQRRSFIKPQSKPRRAFSKARSSTPTQSRTRPKMVTESPGFRPLAHQRRSVSHAASFRHGMTLRRRAL